MCQWVITADHVKGENKGVGNFQGNPTELPFQFRMLNEDRICFEGRSNEKDAFDPLEWGKGAAGCIYIQYRRKNH